MSMQLSTFQTFFEYNRAKDKRCIFAFIFNFKNITIACWLKSPTKTFNGDFWPCLHPGEVWKVNSSIDITILV